MKISLAFLIIMLFALHSRSSQAAAHPTLLLQPFGSEQQAGRLVDGQSEHSRALAISQQIQTLLTAEGRINAYTATPYGKSYQPGQFLSLVNSITQLFLLAITVYHETDIKPRVALYYRCYNPLTDPIPLPQDPRDFLPLEKAYLPAFHSARAYALSLTRSLQASPLVHCLPAQGIPLAQLVGVRHPACSLELGLNKDHDIEAISRLIAQELSRLLA